MADNLPPDVLTLIFNRLSAKSLLQCTSVCKPWHSFITSQTFIEAHLNRQKPHDLFLVRSHPSGSKKEVYSLHCDDDMFTKHADIDVPFSPACNDYYRIVGSCKGIVCLSDDLFYYADEVILWNPAIRKWLRLPQPRISLTSGAFEGVIGFGIDSESNDYKVVRIVYIDGIHSPAEVDVYSLNSGIWRNISDLGLNLQHFIWPRTPQAYINGAVHWIVADTSARRNIILSFNMTSELFHTMEIPDTLQYVFALTYNTKLIIKAINGSLSLVECDNRRCCIWLMEEYGVFSSWTKKVDVMVNGMIDRLIGYRLNGKLLFEVEGSLCSYDPQRRNQAIFDEELRHIQAALGMSDEEFLRTVGPHLPQFTGLKKIGIHSRYGDYGNSVDKCALHIESYTESLVLVGMQTQVEEDETESGEEETETISSIISLLLFRG